MEKNNPVRLADDERKFIWPESSEHNRDIIVSIGTGYLTNYDGKHEKDQKLSSFLQGLQNLGIVRKVVILKSVLQSTLNCQKMWDEFISSIGTDEYLVGKCHRINVPYGVGQSLCCLDDWPKMKDAKAEALKVLRGNSVSVSSFVQDQLCEQLDVIARQLLASLFYMTIRSLVSSDNSDAKICHGWIKCRLNRSYENQFYSLQRKDPDFRVIDSFGKKHNLAFELGSWDATFSIPVWFQISRESAEVRIEVTLDNGNHWDSISGFPRHLRDHIS